MSSHNLWPCFHYQRWIHTIVCRDMKAWKHPGRTHKTKALSSNNHSKSVINPWFESWSSPQTHGLTAPSISSLERKQLGFDQYFKPNQWSWLKVNSELWELFHIVGSPPKRLLWAPQPGESVTSHLCLLILTASTGTDLKGISRRWNEVTQSLWLTQVGERGVKGVQLLHRKQGPWSMQGFQTLGFFATFIGTDRLRALRDKGSQIKQANWSQMEWLRNSLHSKMGQIAF